MKMKIEHYNHIKSAIEKYIAEVGIESLISDYENGKFPRSADVKDLNIRFCWDLHYKADLIKYTCETLYDYLHDGHILTALKSIAPKLVRKY